MKGGIAAFTTATERFIEAHPNHKGRIGFLITSDEEGPAQYGTKAVMDALSARGEQIDLCIVGEPTSETRLGDAIKVGRRGSINGSLTVFGKQGHIAYPHLADNAIHLALPLLKALCDLQWDEGNEQFPPTSFQFSNLRAGTGASNVVPGTAEADFNLRFSPEITVDEIKARVDAQAQALELKVKIDWHLSGLPFSTQYDSLIKAVEQSVFDLTGYKPKLSTSGGTSDGRFIAPTGAQVIELGPINKTIHQVNECVSVSDLDQLSLIYEGILNRLLT